METKEKSELTVIEKAIRVYSKMRLALLALEKKRFVKAEPILADMAQVEGHLIALFTKDKDMNALVQLYNEGRDEMDALDAQHTKNKAHVMLRQEKIEDVIFNILRETNSESVRTKNGTAFTSTQTSVKIADWKIFLQHVIDTGQWELLKRAASKDAVKASIEETKKGVPGVDFSTRLQVSVRRK